MKLRRSSLLSSSLLLRSIIALGAWASTGQLHAADIYWDSDGATAGGSSGTTATGNWGTSAFWSTDSTGASPTTATWAGTDTAVFSAGTDVTGASTVTINANTAAAGLKFEEGNITFVSATSAKSLTLSSNLDLTLGSRGVVFGTTTAATTVNLLLGSNSLTLNTGNLDLYGTNTMAGATLKSGNITIGNASAFGTTGTVTLGDTAASSSPRFRMRTLSLSRPFVLQSGTGFTLSAALDNVGFNSPTITGGVTSTGTGTTNLTISSIISNGSGSSTTFTASGSAINHTGTLSLRNSGTNNVAGNAPTGTINITAPIGSNVAAVSISNDAAGTSPAATTDVGTQLVAFGSTSNAYTGATTINANATLRLSVNDVIPDGGGKGGVVVNGRLDLFQSDTTKSETINGLSGSGVITRSSTGTTTLTVGSNGATSTFSGVIQNGAGTVAITKTGSGTLTLTGNNTQTGTTSIRAGTLLAGSNNALGAGSVSLGFSTPATLLTNGAFTIPNAIQVSANPSSGTHTLGGNTDNSSTFSGAILLAGNATISQAATTDGNALNLTGGIGANNPGTQTLTFAGPGDINVSTTPITNGTIGVVAVKVTGGKTTFATANTYTGNTSVEAGELVLQNATSLANVSTVEITSGATLKLDFVGTDTIARLTFNGIQQAAGTWGAPGSGAANEDARITGTGLLLVEPTDFIWTNTSGDEKWSTAANWDVNLAPTTGVTLQFPAAVDTDLINDLASGSSFSSLLFVSGAPAYTIDGTNSLNLTTGITNSSTEQQTLGFPIVLASTGAFPINVGSQGVVLNGDLSGTVGLSKLGTSTLKLTGTNTYSGNTTIFSGDIWATGASSLPSGTTVAFANTSGTATLDITGLTQTLAGLTFATQTTGSNAVSIVGDSSTSLTVSPASITFAPAAAAAANTLNFSAATLGSFTYNNSTGTFAVQNGGSTNTGSQTVTLSGTSNSITAANLNIGNLGGGDSAGGNVSTLNLGESNTLNATTFNIGASSSRASGVVKFANGLTNPTLTLKGVTGGSSTANLNIGGYDNFGTNAYSATFDATNPGGTGPGTLDAQLGTVQIGRIFPTSASTARASVNTSTLKTGNGTLSASSISLGNIGSRTTNTGTYRFGVTASYELNGGTANIGTLTLATSSYADPLLTGSNTLSAIATLNAGATLNATTIQRGSIATPSSGSLTATSQINWNEGTIGNIPTGDLSISGSTIVLGTTATHTFNISSGRTATVSSVISTLSGETPLTKTGEGTLILSAANTYVGDTIVTHGVLETTTPFLDDASNVEISTGGQLKLNFSGTDIIDTLSFNGVPQPSGTTYGATGSGAAVIDDTRFSGTGKIQVGVISDPFVAWIGGFGLAIGDQDKSDDPDADGRNNLLEFALNGNPAIGGTNTRERTAISNLSGSDYLTLTLPVRVGATFSGPGDLVSAPIDKIIYTVQGSTDLTDFTSNGVMEVTPTLSSGMPTADTGWEYRTFRLTTPLTGNPKGFLRINAVAAP